MRSEASAPFNASSPRFTGPPRTAVLVSGSGRSLRNLLERERVGRLPTQIALVIGSKAELPALLHAQAFGVPTEVLPPAAINTTLQAHGIELVVLAGYLKRWPLAPEFEGRAINIHPSLLPLFGGAGMYGHKVHEAVLASGMRVSGATVHFVSDAYDQGPILAQTAVPVPLGDDVSSLAQRVFAAELELLPRAIEALVRGQWMLHEGRVVRGP